jgi:preprotein translocase SecE subunit
MEGVRNSQTLWDVGDDNQRMLTWAYLGFGLLIVFVLGYFFQYFVEIVVPRVFADSSLALTIERLPIKIGFIFSSASAVGAGFYARYNPQVNTFGLEVVAELKKVTWSTMDVTWKSTIAVIITVLICALILALFDFIWGGISGWLLK